MPRFPSDITYSPKYCDENYEYRNVSLPEVLYNRIGHHRLLSENEWRSLGIEGSDGWVHYMTYRPEPHIIMLRKPKRK